MITLARVGDVVRFTFQDNPLYLNNGTIEVPVNSLSLLIDESNIATFKKAASNDIFLSCSLDELGMTRTQLINWYKDNMVDEGITPEEVEDIVESATTNLFGYAEYDSQNTRINFKHDANGSVISSIDASDFVIDGMIDNVEIVTVEGVKYLKITFNTESGKEPILIPLADIFNPDNYYTKTEVDNAISAATSGKADTSAVTEAIDIIDAAYKAADSAISGAVDSVSGDVATEAQRAISAETALDEKIDEKLDISDWDDAQELISKSLNDLNTRKLDASAYTPTDLSNYYTKSETDGEIEEAVSGKADTTAVTQAISAAVSGKADSDSVYTKTEVDSALSGKADTSAVTEAISAAVSGKADSNNVYTKSEANALLAAKADTATTYTKTEVDSALSGKQDTLVAGTNIKTINNESILGSGNIDIQGGGGKAVSAGTNISITTGETADTINCTLPISVGTGDYLLLYNNNSNNITSVSKFGFICGSQNGLYNPIDSNSTFIIGDWNEVTANSVFIHGHSCNAKGLRNFISGYKLNTNYSEETAFGHWNNSVTGSTDADKTLFSVGNGTASNTRHNAFEIRQNGDIYLTKDGQDVKLQDQLGGGSSYTAGDGIDITNDIISVTGKVDTTTYNTYTAATDTALTSKADTATTYTKTEVDNAITAATSTKQNTLVAGRGISITTGETADTVSFSLPISAGTGTDSVVEGYNTIASGDNSHAEGLMTQAIGAYSHAEGSQTQAKSTCSHAEGLFTSAATPYSFACGLNGVASGDSLTVSDTNTIFAIGNGLDNTHRTTNPHNAFEVKLNGDIYIADTNDTSTSQYYRKPMIKLQDALGGGSSYTAGDGINITNDVISVTGKADTSAVTEAISAAVSGKADSNNVYTKTETDSALSGKQDTLVSGTNIKTINNESILGSGNIDIQGGGGKAVSAGTNISITTGETADTINCTLPITAGTGTNSIIFGDSKNVANGVCAFAGGTTSSFLKNEATNEASFAFGRCCKATGSYSHAEGFITKASGSRSHAEGDNTEAQGSCSHAEGYKTSATTEESHAEGFLTTASGRYSHAEGSYTKTSNQSEHASGQYNNSVSASTTFGDSGNTLFSVGNGTADNARHNAFEIRQNGDIYLTKDGQDVKLQDQLGGGGSSYTAGDGIDITNDVISVTGKVDTSAITTSMTSGSTDSQVPSAKAVYDNFGGLKLVKLTQAEYDALVTKDSDTLYVVTDN